MINAIKEAVELLLNTVGSLLWEILKALFGVEKSFDDAKEEIIAAIFGVPGIVVSVVFAIISIVGLVIFLVKLGNKNKRDQD